MCAENECTIEQDEFACTICNPEYFRTLVDYTCECMEGYENVEGELTCVRPTERDCHELCAVD